jgi:hypothetical protein
MVYRFILLKENLRLIWALDLKMSGQDFIKTKSYLASNPGRWYEIRWLRSLLLHQFGQDRTEAWVAPWPAAWGLKLNVRGTKHDDDSSYII